MLIMPSGRSLYTLFIGSQPIERAFEGAQFKLIALNQPPQMISQTLLLLLLLLLLLPLLLHNHRLLPFVRNEPRGLSDGNWNEF